MKQNTVTDNVDLKGTTKIYHHPLNLADQKAKTYVWENESSIPFDELIISWNAMRQLYGEYVISVSVKFEQWSPWFVYAHWGSKGQQGGDVSPVDVPLRIKQDILEITHGEKATGFRIRIDTVDDGNLDEFYSLHACATQLGDLAVKQNITLDSSIDLQVPLVSQMTLPHQRNRDMCSPTSTSAAISFLLKKNRIDPVSFALQARDEAFDIFGNWVLNAAHASAVMGKNWTCWVQRLQGFEDIYASLQKGIPVVVSIRGPLPGSPHPYAQGHLLVVKGYRAEDRHVLCMDPAYPDDESTNVSYKLEDFVKAWSRRKYLAYIFRCRSSL